MTRKINPKQIQKALQTCRFPEQSGWTINAPTTTSLVVTNANESEGPVVIELLHDANPASRDDQLSTALGRLLLTMGDHSPTMSWAIAAPHTDAWLETLERVPLRVLATFRLTLMLVGEDSVTDYPNTYEYDERVLLDDEDLSDMVLGEDAEREIDDMLRGL